MANSKKNNWKESFLNSKQRNYSFDSGSGRVIEPLYTGKDDSDDIEYPGQYPYTRGVHANMYRGKLWTMRQFSGFGAPEETNQRFKFLLDSGQTGLSTAFDMPTLMGYDADHPISDGEVGHCGLLRLKARIEIIAITKTKAVKKGLLCDFSDCSSELTCI